MLIDKNDIAKVFESIQSVYIKYKRAVIIICSIDCDSVCTVKILTALMRAENIAFMVLPVYSYENIIGFNKKILQPKIIDDKLHTIVLINCGALIDLNELFFHLPLKQKYNEMVENKLRFRNQFQREEKMIDEIPDIDTYIDENVEYPEKPFAIYVIDSHRPFNLFNVYDKQRVMFYNHI